MMLTIYNESLLAVESFEGFDREGNAQTTLIAKAQYQFDLNGNLSLQAAPALESVDVWCGKPYFSSLKVANEIAPFKQGADLLLQGTLRPPHPHYQAMDVTLSLQHQDVNWKKCLRVFGPRRWQINRLRPSLSKAKSLAPITLQYEYAYGGVCPGNDKKMYAANPAGIGYVTRERFSFKKLAPQIEYADHLIKSPLQKDIIPAGFAPIPLSWAPRNQQATNTWGAFKSADYQQAISLPSHFYNQAPRDQQFKKTFIGGECIGIQGLIADISLSDTLKIIVPKAKPKFIWSRSTECELRCDTISINSDNKTLTQLWRGALPESTQDLWLEVEGLA